MTAEAAYAFRHAILRDAAVQLQLPHDRARLHGFAADLMEEMLGEELGAWATDIAGHLRQARALVPGSRPGPRETALLRRGAEYAEAHWQNEAAEAGWLAVAEADPDARPHALQKAGMLACESGHVPRAEAQFREAVECAVHPQDIAAAVAGLANVHREMGRMREAEEGFRRAAEIDRANGRRASLGGILGNLATLLFQTGRSAEAWKVFEEALELLRDGPDRRRYAIVLGNYAQARQIHDRNDADAGRLLDEALAIHRETGNRLMEGLVLSRFAADLAERGRPEEALRLADEALRVLREAGHRPGVAVVVGNSAAALAALGRTEEAERAFREGIAVTQSLGSRRNEGVFRGNYANFLMDRGRTGEADEMYASAQAIHAEVGNPVAAAVHRGNQASRLMRRGQRERALAAWDDVQAFLSARRGSDHAVDLEREWRAACSSAGGPDAAGPPPSGSGG